MSANDNVRHPRIPPRTAYETDLGAFVLGKAEDVLASKMGEQLKKQVDLIFTSPPFPLNTKKRYGNLKSEEYFKWLAGMTESTADASLCRAAIYHSYLVESTVSSAVWTVQKRPKSAPKCNHWLISVCSHHSLLRTKAEGIGTPAIKNPRCANGAVRHGRQLGHDQRSAARYGTE